MVMTSSQIASCTFAVQAKGHQSQRTKEVERVSALEAVRTFGYECLQSNALVSRDS